MQSNNSWEEWPTNVSDYCYKIEQEVKEISAKEKAFNLWLEEKYENYQEIDEHTSKNLHDTWYQKNWKEESKQYTNPKGAKFEEWFNVNFPDNHDMEEETKSELWLIWNEMYRDVEQCKDEELENLDDYLQQQSESYYVNEEEEAFK